MARRKPSETPAPTPSTAPSASSTPLAGCLLRIIWMFLGNLALAGAAAAVFLAPAGTRYSLADLSFVLAAGGLAFVRYADIAYFHGTTARGEPATLKDWWGYVRVLAVVTVVLWLGSHALGALLHR
ncbi:MAG: hypothetical protein HY904_12430 [Deltaproteobacteria bacterium]|nr:hypothetical protein [Deltaproteobacteria bacterium]